MANKIMVMLGLANEGEVVVKSHRKKRQADYMKKIQSLVVPEDESEEDSLARTGAAEQPETPETAEAETVETAAEAAAPLPAQDAGEGDTPEPSAPVAPEDEAPKSSFMKKMRRLAEPLRRPESETALILVRHDVEGMLNDIEGAMLEGRTLLVDFAEQNERDARTTVERLTTFVKMKKGYSYPVTRTSLLISLRNDVVVEWLPEAEDAEPQNE